MPADAFGRSSTLAATEFLNRFNVAVTSDSENPQWRKFKVCTCLGPRRGDHQQHHWVACNVDSRMLARRRMLRSTSTWICRLKMPRLFPANNREGRAIQIHTIMDFNRKQVRALMMTNKAELSDILSVPGFFEPIQRGPDFRL